MIDEIEARAAKIAEYVITTGATVRAAAKFFGISKSTVHTAVTLSNGLYGWWRRNHVASNKKTAVGSVNSLPPLCLPAVILMTSKLF